MIFRVADENARRQKREIAQAIPVPISWRIDATYQCNKEDDEAAR
jgi:hypothetical protein